MIEILIFLIVIFIIVPALLLTSILYNINRRIQGKQPLTTEDAVKELTRNMFRKIQNFLDPNTKVNNKSSKTSKGNKKEDKGKFHNQRSETKVNVEDAEFREINS